jgi:hypothetical protein
MTESLREQGKSSESKSKRPYNKKSRLPEIEVAAGSPQAVHVATATAPLLRRMAEVMLRDGVRQGHLAAQTGISDSVVSLLLVNKYKFHTVSS